jgi:deoxyinosine 3'endonuclease (endonuclease V)
VVTTGAGVEVDATGASVLGVLVAFAALGVATAAVAGTGEAAGRGEGAEAEVEEEEDFFAILCWYTLLGEVFLSIFRQYILYLLCASKSVLCYRLNFN